MSTETQKISLTVSARTTDETAADIRKQGWIPVELYGKKIKNKQLKAHHVAFNKAFDMAGESALIDLFVDEKEEGKVLIKDIQLDPVKDTIIHADVYRIDENEMLQTEIPLEFVGEAPAVKEMGGILVKQVDKIEVKCLPANLVHEIKVDVSCLKAFTDSILVTNLHIPEGIEILTDPTVLIAAVSEPRKVEEETPEPTESAADEAGAEGEESPEDAAGEAGAEGEESDEKTA